MDWVKFLHNPLLKIKFKGSVMFLLLLSLSPISTFISDIIKRISLLWSWRTSLQSHVGWLILNDVYGYFRMWLISSINGIDAMLDNCQQISLVLCYCREASNSILSFLSDVFDLTNSREGVQYQHIRDNVIIPRGPTITRILIASLTGALPSNRFETVSSIQSRKSKI